MRIHSFNGYHLLQLKPFLCKQKPFINYKWYVLQINKHPDHNLRECGMFFQCSYYGSLYFNLLEVPPPPTHTHTLRPASFIPIKAAYISNLPCCNLKLICCFPALFNLWSQIFSCTCNYLSYTHSCCILIKAQLITWFASFNSYHV